MKRTVLLFFVLICGLSLAKAQTIVMGPYLQFPTSSSMKVKWDTDIATPSRIYFGTSLSSVMTDTIDLSDPVTDHTVNISGLQSNTEYYYAVSDGVSVLSGADENHRFTTSPEIGTVQPINVWAIGDFGKGNDKQLAVKQSFLDYAGDDLPDLWLWLGDNAYDNGTLDEYRTKVFDSIYGYSELFSRVPFMPTPGNHDYGSVLNILVGANPPDHDGPYYDIVDVPTNGEMGGVPSTYELYYSFDYGNVHFLSLNSEIGSIFNASWDWTGASPFNTFNGSPFTQWLNADLQANDKPWVVAFFHQPPFTDGSHDSGTFWEVFMQAMRENICPILESYGVDVVICGHSHVYERSYLINGFFGLPADFVPAQHLLNGTSGNLSEGTPYIKYLNGPDQNKGTVYVVQGNSGSSDSNPGLQHPVMYAGHGCDTCVGSTMLYINADTLTGRYLASTGEIQDEWTIIKQDYVDGVGEDPDLAIGGLTVSPNPLVSRAEVSFSVNQNLHADVEMIGLSGQIVHTLYSGSLTPGAHTFSIDAKGWGLAKGPYLIRVVSDKQPATAKLLTID